MNTPLIEGCLDTESLAGLMDRAGEMEVLRQVFLQAAGGIEIMAGCGVKGERELRACAQIVRALPAQE